MALPKAFAFDVFGTVVDWRTSIARESGPFLCEIGRGKAPLERAYPDTDFIWMDTEQSSGEVFWLEQT